MIRPSWELMPGASKVRAWLDRHRDDGPLLGVQNPQVDAQLVCTHANTAESFGAPVGCVASHAAAQAASAHAS